MTITKTLATCDLPDFLRQSIRMKDAITAWSEQTGFMDIIRKQADLTGEETEDERKKIVHEQFTKNLSEALTVAMGENAELTSEIMALCCFVEPEDIPKYRAIDFMVSFMECISNKDVRDFFISLSKMGRTGTV